MIKRLKTSAGLVAGLAALSLGGAAIAGAASTSTQANASVPAKHEVTTGRDTDNVQSGDQTTPDTKAGAAKEVVNGPDIGTTQSGSQTTPDPAGSTSETSSETSGESAANNDGPGGYADPAGNANTQQQGQN
jgi:hypothetical protein